MHQMHREYYSSHCVAYYDLVISRYIIYASDASPWIFIMTLLSAIKSPATVNLVTIFSTRGSGSSLYSYITNITWIPELTQGDLEQIYDHEFYPLHLETQMFFSTHCKQKMAVAVKFAATGLRQLSVKFEVKWLRATCTAASLAEDQQHRFSNALAIFWCFAMHRSCWRCLRWLHINIMLC